MKANENQSPSYVLDELHSLVSDLIDSTGNAGRREIRKVFRSTLIYAVPCFQYAKSNNENPVEVAEQLADDWNGEIQSGDWRTRWNVGQFPRAVTVISHFQALKGYVNVYADQSKLLEEILNEIKLAGKKYGDYPKLNKTIVVDYCSPNIAKPLSVGHLRSTIIGKALINILEANGYQVVGINFMGDWGTQFGKLLVAFEHWGDEKKLKTDPIPYLVELYVKFHKEASANPALEDEARAAFKRLGDGAEREIKLWRSFRERSLEAFKKTRERLNVARLDVKFDHNWFESDFEKKARELVNELLTQGVAKKSEGAVIIPIPSPLEAGVWETPLLLRKSDGTTLYAARDLASALTRLEQFEPVQELIYVVASEQNLYFAQLSNALEIMRGKGFFKDIQMGPRFILNHVNFGMVSLPSGKISTREGRVVYLDELLDEAQRRAAEIITEKNPDMAADTKAEVARRVGIGAVIYADLSQDRIKDIVFDWKRMLAFDGNSAPYLQYAAVRCARILQKAGLPTGEWVQGTDSAKLEEPESVELVMALGRFPQAIAEAAERYAPHVLAGYLYDVATSLSRFYTQVPVLKAAGEATRLTRLGLVQATESVLRRGLALLGIQTPSEM